MIRGVIFDVGGPLDLETEFEAAIDADIRLGLRNEGLNVDEAAWAEAHRIAVDTCAPSLYRSVIWQLTGGDYGRSVRIYEWMEGRAHERSLFELRPGMPEILTELKLRGLKLGLAANQPLRALDDLAAHGIGDFFDNSGISAVYGFRKPDVRLFLRACEDLGLEPAQCIMVGDRIDNDVVPAKLLGMRTVRIRTGRHRDQKPRSWDEMPDVEVEDAAGILKGVLHIIEEAG